MIILRYVLWPRINILDCAAMGLLLGLMRDGGSSLWWSLAVLPWCFLSVLAERSLFGMTRP
ncbi:hypothetical protein [Roseomonas indoligenes]|uniref:Uncharacterized protein n=1 Tax=Roseomonas indoligenes TaxID=2820811 RepID=A0A940S6J0_9PROT|nr:hypothetical protein [Pararoseomonas indoligenes]MBP0492102.1 hypothetical protein [Pararoseomonas indoligenes]